MECTKWWHKVFHHCLGSKESRSTVNVKGALPYVDYSYSNMACTICDKKWVIDHTPEIKEWEKLRDQTLFKGKKDA